MRRWLPLPALAVYTAACAQSPSHMHCVKAACLWGVYGPSNGQAPRRRMAGPRLDAALAALARSRSVHRSLHAHLSSHAFCQASLSMDHPVGHQSPGASPAPGRFVSWCAAGCPCPLGQCTPQPALKIPLTCIVSRQPVYGALMGHQMARRLAGAWQVRALMHCWLHRLARAAYATACACGRTHNSTHVLCQAS